MAEPIRVDRLEAVLAGAPPAGEAEEATARLVLELRRASPGAPATLRRRVRTLAAGRRGRGVVIRRLAWAAPLALAAAAAASLLGGTREAERWGPSTAQRPDAPPSIASREDGHRDVAPGAVSARPKLRRATPPPAAAGPPSLLARTPTPVAPVPPAVAAPPAPVPGAGRGGCVDGAGALGRIQPVPEEEEEPAPAEPPPGTPPVGAPSSGEAGSQADEQYADPLAADAPRAGSAEGGGRRRGAGC